MSWWLGVEHFLDPEGPHPQDYLQSYSSTVADLTTWICTGQLRSHPNVPYAVTSWDLYLRNQGQLLLSAGPWLFLMGQDFPGVWNRRGEDGESYLKLALNLDFCLVICVAGQGRVPHVPCN